MSDPLARLLLALVSSSADSLVTEGREGGGGGETVTTRSSKKQRRRKGRIDASSSADRLDQATSSVARPLTQLTTTLSYIQGLIRLNKEERESLLLVQAQNNDNNGDNTSLSLLASSILLLQERMHGKRWLSLSERDRLESMVLQDFSLVGRHERFLTVGELFLLYYASGIYERRTNGRCLETRYTKLNYPSRTDFISGSSSIAAKIPESKRGLNSIIVVGLAKQGKSAVCGRLVQALGGCSLRSIGKVQAAARRHTTNPQVDEATWMMDRSILERMKKATYYTKGFPLYHRNVGSFTVIDTPPFVTYRDDHESSGVELESYPGINRRRRTVMAELTTAGPTDVIVVCLSVNYWKKQQNRGGGADDDNIAVVEDEEVRNLVLQIRAATTDWSKSDGAMRVVFAITKMDLVDWDFASYQETANRIRAIACPAGESVTIVPTSALVPAFGIFHSHRSAWNGGSYAKKTTTTTEAKKEERVEPPQPLPSASSILSVAFEVFMSSSKTITPSSTVLLESEDSYLKSGGAIVYVLFRHTNSGKRRLEEGEYLFTVKVIRGSLAVGHILQSRCPHAPFNARIKSIEWYGNPCSTGHANQTVGIKVEMKFKSGYFVTPLVLYAYQAAESSSTTNFDRFAKIRMIIRLFYIRSKDGDGRDISVAERCKKLKLVAYPNQFSAYMGATTTLDYKGQTLLECREVTGDAFLGQKLVLYTQEDSREMVGIGVIVQLDVHEALSEAREAEALNWLARELGVADTAALGMPSSSLSIPRPLLPKPAPIVLATSRNISTISNLSASVVSTGGVSNASGTYLGPPAKSIDEAIHQTDAAVKSLLRLKDELERAKRAQKEEDEMAACYICRRQCRPSSASGSLGKTVLMCKKCITLNEFKRKCPLLIPKDSTVVVTGGRIKIGYALVNRLILEEGVKCLVLTTRFPFLLAKKLCEDYPSEMNTKIHIYGCDFRSEEDVEKLGEHLAKHYPEVFALINNAAQTVRRPPAFYLTLVEEELKLARNPGNLLDMVKSVGSDPHVEDATLQMEALSIVDNLKDSTTVPRVQNFRDCQSYPASASALMTQCPVSDEDKTLIGEAVKTLFPVCEGGTTDDTTGETVSDLRPANSWRKSILPNRHTETTVETAEFHEVLLVNTLAPFVLLKSLLGSLKAVVGGGNVVNVTSQEGVFKHASSSMHPHTNTAKAGLNMLTKTVSHELKAADIMICCVDTGWISNYNGAGDGGVVSPPLTVEDGAARILDPITQRLMNDKRGKRTYKTGVFFHNFKGTPYM